MPAALFKSHSEFLAPFLGDASKGAKTTDWILKMVKAAFMLT